MSYNFDFAKLYTNTITECNILPENPAAQETLHRIFAQRKAKKRIVKINNLLNEEEDQEALQPRPD